MKNRKDYYAGLTIGEKTLEYQLKRDRNDGSSLFRWTKFKTLSSFYFAIERDGYGWRSGRFYEVQDAGGNLVQSLIRNGRQIRFGETAKNRKDLINRFKTLTEDGWEPIDGFYYSHD